MISRHIILRNLPSILDLFLRQEILDIGFLQERVTLHFLGGQDAFYRGRTPAIFSSRSLYLPLCQFVDNGLIGKPAHEEFVNQTHDFRFFVIDCKITVCTSFITEQMGKRYAYFSIGETFSLAPFDILRNAAALLLR